MRDKQDFTIDDIPYVIYPMNVMKANSTMIKIIKLLGKPVATLIFELIKGDEKKSVLDIDLDNKSADNMEAIANAIIELSANLDEVEINKLFTELISKETVIPDGKKIVTIDSHFNNHGLLHLYKVIWSVLIVNYRDFLEGAVGVLR